MHNMETLLEQVSNHRDLLECAVQKQVTTEKITTAFNISQNRIRQVHARLQTSYSILQCIYAYSVFQVGCSEEINNESCPCLYKYWGLFAPCKKQNPKSVKCSLTLILAYQVAYNNLVASTQ